MKIESFKEVNLKNEQKYVSYLMHNFKEAFSFPLDNFLNINLRHIVEAIQNLNTLDLSYNHDEILILLSDIDSTIDKSQLENIYNTFDNFDNIDFIKKRIKETYLKHNINNTILQDIVVNTNHAGDLDYKKLRDLGNTLIYGLSEVEGKLNIKTAEDLAINYIETINKREEGISQRSLGFAPLNKSITRPAANGEMTGLVSFKGMAKSIFTKTINNILINNRVPVLDLDLEMPEDSSMDRLMAMRGGHSLSELLMQEKEEKMKIRLQRDIELFKRNPYYHYFNEPNISLNDVDALIYKSKAMFRKDNILKGDDDYIFVTIDLLEMLQDFSVPKPEKLIPAINRLHYIAKKHNIHIFFTLQANENKIRSMKFSRPEDLEYYKIGFEDIYGSAVYGGRARVMLSLQRPLHLKNMFFPERMEEWDLEEDIINCHCFKQNDGGLFFQKYVFGKNFKIYPRVEEND